MTNESSSKMSIEDMIGHYQRSIERSQHDPNRVNTDFYLKKKKLTMDNRYG